MTLSTWTHVDFWMLQIGESVDHLFRVKVTAVDVDAAVLVKVQTVQGKLLQRRLHDVAEVAQRSLTDRNHVAQYPVNLNNGNQSRP